MLDLSNHVAGEAQAEQITYDDAVLLVSRHKTKLQQGAEDQCPARFLPYCNRSEIHHYRLFVKVAMLQAAAKRKFYVWSSFDPHTIRGYLVVKDLVNHFKLYTRQAYFDLKEPQLCQLFCTPNDPTYGALMEAREVGDASVDWATHDPGAQQLVGGWGHPY